jgi:CRISPR type I-E-associated protein CasB/Cse2
MSLTQSDPGESRETPWTRRRAAIKAVRAALASADPGTLARLRRSKPSSPPPDFFRIAVGRLDKVIAPGGERRERDESRWALLMKIMAMVGDLLGNVPFGEALAHAKVAERRVLQLLEAHEEQLPALTRQVVSQLVSKGQEVDITELANLILDHGSDGAEKARRQIARSFYRHYEGT